LLDREKLEKLFHTLQVKFLEKICQFHYTTFGSSVSVLSDISLLSDSSGQCRQVPPNLSQCSDAISWLLFQKKKRCLGVASSFHIVLHMSKQSLVWVVVSLNGGGVKHSLSLCLLISWGIKRRIELQAVARILFSIGFDSS
jgi:hypothetical protein